MTNWVAEHAGYAADRVRNQAYTEALRFLARGKVVLDLGCGTGLLGLLALQGGASRVYAVDCSPLVEVARQLYQEAGYADRVQLYRAHSTELQLPEPVDLVICDQLNPYALDAGVLEACSDATERLLRPGGEIVPRRLDLWTCAVSSPVAYKPVEIWSRPAASVGLTGVRPFAANTLYTHKFRPRHCVSRPHRLTRLELKSPQPPYFQWSCQLLSQRRARVHGFALWWEAELAPGITVTNGPEGPRRIEREQAFLPLDRPMQVRPGSEIELTVQARPTDGILAWDCRLGPFRSKHCTWHSQPLSSRYAQKIRPEYRPVLSPRGQAWHRVLSLLDGHNTLHELRERTGERDRRLLQQVVEEFTVD